MLSDGDLLLACPSLIFVKFTYDGGTSGLDANCELIRTRTGAALSFDCLIGVKLAWMSFCWMRVRLDEVGRLMTCLMEVRFGYKLFYLGTVYFMTVKLTF